MVRSMGRGMLLHDSKKGYSEPGDMPSTERSPCRQRAAPEAWLRIRAQACLRKSPSRTAPLICLALAASQPAAPTSTPTLPLQSLTRCSRGLREAGQALVSFHLHLQPVPHPPGPLSSPHLRWEEYPARAEAWEQIRELQVQSDLKES